MTDSRHCVASHARAAIAPFKACEIGEARVPVALLDHPEAQTRLDNATIAPHSIRPCGDRLSGFLQRDLPKNYRVEQRVNAKLAAGGLAFTAIYTGDGNFVGRSQAVGEQVSVPTALAPTT